MKTVYSTVTLILLVLAAGVSAQVPGYPNGCVKCGVFSYIDGPAIQESPLPVLAGEIAINGWGFECVSGRSVNRVDVFYSDDNGYFTPVRASLTSIDLGIARPDVQAAFSGHCPTVQRNAGYTLYVPAGLIPAGTRVLMINAWSGPYFQTHRRVVVVR